MLVRASQALLDAPKKKKVPVSCNRVFHNALLDCCSQFIAKSRGACGDYTGTLTPVESWARTLGPRSRHIGTLKGAGNQAHALREWTQVQDAMAPLLWAV